MPFFINILDTGDNYILAPKNSLNNGYNEGINLYSLIDITINEIITEIAIPNQEIIDFILDNIGRVLSYNISDFTENEEEKIDIPQKLKNDIQITVEFYKIKSFWENLQLNPKKIQKKYDENMLYSRDSLTVQSLLPLQPPNKILDIQFDEHKIITPSISMFNEQLIWVMFNDLYNIAVVVDSDQISDPNNLIKVFPEFKIAVTYSKSELNDEEKTSLIKFFNKISFSDIDEVKKKNDAFKNLYNITLHCDKGHINKDNFKHSEEKRKVKQFLDWHFTLSSDQDKRMKANDLYKEITNHMCVSYNDASAFKKRLAGYLIELKLQKKRFSDAYYYFGIIPKETSNISLDEIEKKRQEEKKLWFKYETIENANDLFQKRIKDREIIMEKMIKGDSTDFRAFLE